MTSRNEVRAALEELGKFTIIEEIEEGRMLSPHFVPSMDCFSAKFSSR